MCHFCVVIFSSTAGALAGMLYHPHGPASFPSTVGVVEVVASMRSITPVQSSRACRGGIIVRGHSHFFYSLPPPASATCPQGLVLMLHRGPSCLSSLFPRRVFSVTAGCGAILDAWQSLDHPLSFWYHTQQLYRSHTLRRYMVYVFRVFAILGSIEIGSWQEFPMPPI